MFFLSIVSPYNKLIKPKKRELWEPLIYSQSVINTGNNLNFPTASEVQGGGHGNLQPVASQSKSQVTTWACDWRLKRGGGLNP